MGLVFYGGGVYRRYRVVREEGEKDGLFMTSSSEERWVARRGAQLVWDRGDVESESKMVYGDDEGEVQRQWVMEVNEGEEWEVVIMCYGDDEG